jgi:hypothetical protein
LLQALSDRIRTPRCARRFSPGPTSTPSTLPRASWASGATGSIFQVNRDTCRWRKGKFEQAIRVAASLDGDDLRFLGERGLIRH